MKSFGELWQEMKEEAFLHGGMADFHLSYHPYKGEWTMKVSYSHTRDPYQGIGSTESESIENLLEILKQLPPYWTEERWNKS